MQPGSTGSAGHRASWQKPHSLAEGGHLGFRLVYRQLWSPPKQGKEGKRPSERRPVAFMPFIRHLEISTCSGALGRGMGGEAVTADILASLTVDHLHLKHRLFRYSRSQQIYHGFLSTLQWAHFSGPGYFRKIPICGTRADS